MNQQGVSDTGKGQDLPCCVAKILLECTVYLLVPTFCIGYSIRVIFPRESVQPLLPKFLVSLQCAATSAVIHNS